MDQTAALKTAPEILTAKNKKRPFYFYWGLGDERTHCIENLTMLVSSGMPIMAALEAISMEVKKKNMKIVITQMHNDIEEGYSLTKVFERAGIFSQHTIALVQLGVESGNLAENLKVASEEEEKNQVFKSKLKSAMMYPVFVFGLTGVIGVGIAWFILPKLTSVFSSLKLDLPLPTIILIAVGTTLQKYGIYVVPGTIIGVTVLIFLLLKIPRVRLLLQALVFHVPGIGRLIKEVEIARFGYLLSTLLEAGIPITKAMESLARAASFDRYKKFYAYLGQSIEEGSSFQHSFAAYPRSGDIIPGGIQQMVFAAEQAGSLTETLKKISEHYEIKTETTTKNISVILEPIMLIIIWGGVVGVAMAVILPIYNLIGQLNH